MWMRAVAEELGILPVEFRVLGEDEFQVRQGYLGIALQYADGPRDRSRGCSARRTWSTD